MSKFLSIFNLVPGWLYASVVAVLAWSVIGLEADKGAALLEAASLRATSANEHAELASSAASSVQLARVKELGMGDNQTKVSDELQKDLGQHADRVNSLRDRMREQARTVSAAGSEPGAACTVAAGGRDGVGDTRLRSAFDGDLVILDGQAQGELADLVVRAREVGKTLKACRALLRQAWAATNDQSSSVTSAAP